MPAISGMPLTQFNPEMLVAFIDELSIDLASLMKIKQQTRRACRC